MRKLIAAINMTLDGYCDHTVGIADALLYGRITYQLMESYWPDVVKNPTGSQPIDEFALLIDNITKIVFSHTLKEVGWKNARLAKGDIKEEVLALKQQTGKALLAGSPSLIAKLTQLDLIDEYQLCVHPIIAGKGLILFKDIHEQKNLKLIKTKPFKSGVITLYYEPVR